MKSNVRLSIICLIWLSGCASLEFSSPTASTPIPVIATNIHTQASATTTPTKTVTPTATITSTVTVTSTITNTPEPTITPEPIYLAPGIPPVSKIIQSAQLNNILSKDFEAYGTHSQSDGVLLLEAPQIEGDPWADEDNAVVYSNFGIEPGKGYIVSFKSTEFGTLVLFSFEKGSYWGDPNYRSLWFVLGDRGDYFSNGISIWVGTSLGPLASTSKLTDEEIRFKHNTWYYLLMRLYNVDKLPGIDIFLWEKRQPGNLQKFSIAIGKSFVQKGELHFVINMPEGKMEIDEYQEVEFFESKQESLVR